MISRSLFVSLMVVTTAIPHTSLLAEECGADWTEFSPYEHPTLLDTGVAYWRYEIALPEKPITIKLSGDFPYARYTSFTVYDQATKDIVRDADGNPSTLADVDLVPDEGSLNPYTPGVERSTAARHYSVTVEPQESNPKAANRLFLPKGTKKAIEIWYRLYLPDGYNFSRGHTGGVPLPKIEVFDAETGAEASCPERETTQFLATGAWRNIPPQAREDGSLRFYRRDGAAMYPNLHTDYLASTLIFRSILPGPDVAVLRVKAPSYSATLAGLGSFLGTEETRYWSFCIGKLSTHTIGCLIDEQIKVDADGFATIVIGPTELKEEVEEKGLSFLDRKRHFMTFLIYRNVMAKADWQYRMQNVPYWGSAEATGVENPDEELEAAKFLGEHSPQGKLCTLEEFREDHCGVPVGSP